MLLLLLLVTLGVLPLLPDAQPGIPPFLQDEATIMGSAAALADAGVSPRVAVDFPMLLSYGADEISSTVAFIADEVQLDPSSKEAQVRGESLRRPSPRRRTVARSTCAGC